MEAGGPDEETATHEWVMLVRYCTHFTGDRCTAEDLAQQALLEAWQKSTRLHTPEARNAWLLGMARNVCLRWMRRRGMSVSRLVSVSHLAGEGEEGLADTSDLEGELERDDLAQLLDRAMTFLPTETRDVLIQKYIEDAPQGDVAARLGLTEGAVEARLSRGKRALRRILTTTLREDAVSYGLIPRGDTGWQETRMWCPDCGQRRLLGRYAEGQELQLDCPSCVGHHRVIHTRSRVAELLWEGLTSAELLEGITGYKPALNRITARLSAFYEHGIAGRRARCRWCGRQAPLRTSPESVSGNHDVQTACSQCGQVSGVSTLTAVASLVPAARDFQRQHGRIRTLHSLRVEVDGVPAMVVRFQSVLGSATLEVVIARDTLRVLGVHGATRG